MEFAKTAGALVRRANDSWMPMGARSFLFAAAISMVVRGG
jgi:hypothetical protein